jgi:hypothetical protein
MLFLFGQKRFELSLNFKAIPSLKTPFILYNTTRGRTHLLAFF